MRLRITNSWAQTLRRWDMALGGASFRMQNTEASLLQHFYKRVRQCYTTTLHTSIAIWRCRIIIVPGVFLLAYYETLVEPTVQQ